MRLEKTARARAALENAKAGGLDLRDRRILILADGKRTREDLLALLGADCAGALDRLVREGFLAAPGSVAPASARRSLVAAKMYLIDMLQLQRTPEAAELRLALQRTVDADALVDRMVEALTHLLAVSPQSYGDRVRSRVIEAVPEDRLSRFTHAVALAPAIAS